SPPRSAADSGPPSCALVGSPSPALGAPSSDVSHTSVIGSRSFLLRRTLAEVAQTSPSWLSFPSPKPAKPGFRRLSEVGQIRRAKWAKCSEQTQTLVQPHEWRRL